MFPNSRSGTSIDVVCTRSFAGAVKFGLTDSRNPPFASTQIQSSSKHLLANTKTNLVPMTHIEKSIHTHFPKPQLISMPRFAAGHTE